MSFALFLAVLCSVSCMIRITYMLVKTSSADEGYIYFRNMEQLI